MVLITLYLVLHVYRSKTTPMVYLYPYPPSSVKPVSFDPVVCPPSPSIMGILFLPPTFVKPDPSRSLHQSNSHLVWLQCLVPYFLPAPIWLCIHLANPVERLFVAYSWSWLPCPTWKQWPTRIFAQWPNQFQNITRQFLLPPAVL